VWVHSSRLPHVLEPAAYHDPDRYRLEIERLFAPAWHCIGTLDDIPRAGDFVTLDLHGTPLLVRNDGGAPRAFLNVCAHRHCLLTHEPRGSCERIVCQYHGWEYDGRGRLASLPDAPSFAAGAVEGSRRGRLALAPHRLETLGRLMFVTLSSDTAPLEEWLGPRTSAIVRAQFGDDWRQVAARRIEHPVNWKAVVENGLESYHVPRVHPTTFKVLVDAREIRHELDERGTTHEDVEQGSSAAYRWLMRRIREAPRQHYLHRHAFPSLTFACTDATSVLQVIVPTSPTTSHSLVRLLVHRGEGGRLAGRLLSRAVAPVATRFMDAVMREDGAIFTDLARGLAASVHAGVIGAREERVFAFQRWLAAAIGDGQGAAQEQPRPVCGVSDY
jgi:choline monooxygenase